MNLFDFIFFAIYILVIGICTYWLYLARKINEYENEFYAFLHFLSIIPIMNFGAIIIILIFFGDDILDSYKEKRHLKKFPELNSLNVLNEITEILKKEEYVYNQKKLLLFYNRLTPLVYKLKSNYNEHDFPLLLLKYEVTFNKILAILKDNIDNNGKVSVEILTTSKEAIEIFINEAVLEFERINQIEELSKEETKKRQINEIKEEINMFKKKAV